ncbi:MAG: hypothetical protein ABIX28_02490, partial [Vicinamibacterales bacterium]
MYRVRLSRVLQRLFVIAIFAAHARTAFAQTTANPTWVEFLPSPDDALQASDGSAIVNEYQLAFYVAGQPSAFRTLGLGKPAPDPDGKVRVDFMSLMSPFATPGVTYEARVLATGP